MAHPDSTMRFPRWSAPALFMIAAVLLVFHGALGLYFAQDDFGSLASVTGAAARYVSPWRYVSVQSFMDLTYPLFRTQAWPYHAVVLLIHAGNAVALFTLLSRRFATTAALLGATFFAVHPALFTSLYWLSARSDVLAASFALATLVLASRRESIRWLALPAFALSLLSKESTVLLPGIVYILLRATTREDGRSGAARRSGVVAASTAVRHARGVLVALASMSVGFIAWLALVGRSGIRVGFDPAAAYALDFGNSVARNALTYVGWATDLILRRTDLRFVDSQNAASYAGSIAALIAVVALGFLPALRKKGWWAGVASFVLLLVPVLPLRNHTYRYYLYSALMAAGWCVAVLADAVFDGVAKRPNRKSRKQSPAVSGPKWRTPRHAGIEWFVAGAICIAMTFNGARLISIMEHRPSPVYPGLRGDPIVDRARIARRAIETLRTARLEAGTKLVFLFRERLARVGRVARGSREPPPPDQPVYPELNMRSALFDGLGVRAILEHVDSVTFALEPGAPSPRTRFAVYAPTGEVDVFTPSALDSVMRSDWVTLW